MTNIRFFPNKNWKFNNFIYLIDTNKITNNNNNNIFRTMSTTTQQPSLSSSSSSITFAKEFLSFVNSSPSQFHVIRTSKELLDSNNYKQIKETDDWSKILKPNGHYYLTRNESSIIAFSIGPKYTFNSTNGFLIAAAHTDSPVLKLKPISKVTKHGYLQVGVQPYGGGLWNTWFDRDLSIAGRVIIKLNSKYETKLLCIKKPILRIPNLAIHLNRDVNDKGFAPNKQTHLLPILATNIKNELNQTKNDKNDKNDNKSTTNEEIHHTLLLQLISQELNVSIDSIVDFELSLYDTHESQLSGALDEFIVSRALDNQMMSFISLRSLIDSIKDKNWENELNIRVVALFDNEEVGSNSMMGAGSNLLYSFMKRIQSLNTNNTNESNNFYGSIRNSVLISADMAHAIHPNYSDVHEEFHRPQIHKGLVIKDNANQRYATTTLISFIFKELSTKYNLPLQNFVVRNDMGCGSTIGPILSTNCGIRTIDVGVPQLSMHSIREMCGVEDVYTSYQLIIKIFQEFSTMDKQLSLQSGEQ